MYWPLGVVVVVSIVPVTLTVLHFQREYTRLSRFAQTSPATSPPTSRSPLSASG